MCTFKHDKNLLVMTHEKLKVAYIQSSLVWENPSENLNRFSKKIESIDQTIDLLVLPEMFTTGFTMNTSCVSKEDQENTIGWMKQVAAKKQTCVIGSIIYKEGEVNYNRLWVIFPSGESLFYDKKHLFTLAKEHENYSPGNKQLLFEYKGWRIAPFICYDLRFPVWSRNMNNFDLLLYVANWPKIRVDAWDTLLKARAIENMSYCLGVNRSGIDGKNFEYSGNSALYDMLGRHLTEKDNHFTEFCEVVELSYSELHKIREKLGFLNDRDSFELN